MDCTPLNKVVFIRKIASYASRSTGDLASLTHVTSDWHDAMRNYAPHLFKRSIPMDKSTCLIKFVKSCVSPTTEGDSEENSSLWVTGAYIFYWISVHAPDTIWKEVPEHVANLAGVPASAFGTPTAYAARHGKLKLLSLLLEKGFPIHLYDSSGHCCATRMAETGSVPMFRALLAHCCKNTVDKPDETKAQLKRLFYRVSDEEENILQIALRCGKFDLANEILSLTLPSAERTVRKCCYTTDDFQDDIRDADDGTILHSLAAAEAIDDEKQLEAMNTIFKGLFRSDKSAFLSLLQHKDRFGKNALHVAISCCAAPLVKWIVERFATPLLSISTSGGGPNQQFMGEAGAAAAAGADESQTCLELACTDFDSQNKKKLPHVGVQVQRKADVVKTLLEHQQQTVSPKLPLAMEMLKKYFSSLCAVGDMPASTLQLILDIANKIHGGGDAPAKRILNESQSTGVSRLKDGLRKPPLSILYKAAERLCKKMTAGEEEKAAAAASNQETLERIVGNLKLVCNGMDQAAALQPMPAEPVPMKDESVVNTVSITRGKGFDYVFGPSASASAAAALDEKMKKEKKLKEEEEEKLHAFKPSGLPPNAPVPLNKTPFHFLLTRLEENKLFALKEEVETLQKVVDEKGLGIFLH